ncbi:hypothetical protein B0H13DRAFT_1902259 [Mycena leptocephala]|nr:hypothetical protein B0H13DRAFT_1902259 [Mycena leptocephala]
MSKCLQSAAHPLYFVQVGVIDAESLWWRRKVSSMRDAKCLQSAAHPLYFVQVGVIDAESLWWRRKVSSMRDANKARSDKFKFNELTAKLVAMHETFQLRHTHWVPFAIRHFSISISTVDVRPNFVSIQFCFRFDLPPRSSQYRNLDYCQSISTVELRPAFLFSSIGQLTSLNFPVSTDHLQISKQLPVSSLLNPVRFRRIEINFYSSAARSFRCTMPWNMDEFAASLPDDVRKSIMSRLRGGLSQSAPVQGTSGGVVYTHFRPNWEVLDNAGDLPDDEELDWVDVKVGQAHDLDLRRDDYDLDCVDEPILWAYCYKTSHPKLIERLTHLTLLAMGAKRVPYSCYGCGVRHREHFSEAKSGGLEVVAAIIEYWMQRIGEVPTRSPIYSR